MTKDYYRILGLTGHAEDVVIRAAFKLLAHRYHPDKCQQEIEQAHRRMAEINAAYQHLSGISFKDKLLDDSDFYQVLGVLPFVDAQMIDVAYEALVKKYRYSSKRLKQINQAYTVLSDAQQRRWYDFKQKSVLSSGSGLNLWQVYLVYNLGFYLLIAVIFVLGWYLSSL